ncbi:MAG: Gfo/Idh/MocA family protein [Planctomycetia bacterium]
MANRRPSQVAGPSRRDFLGRSLALGAAAVPTFVSARALGLEKGTAAASDRVTLGVIGIGNRCTYVLGSMMTLPDVQCVAIADVQASRRDAGKKLVDQKYGNGDCVLYRDFRELLARKDIDAVLIATGDRWHGPASIMAAEAGKDVYSEKPCGLTIEICQQLAETVKKTGRIFQAGTQRRSVPNFVAAMELARSGKLGKLERLNASVYEPKLGNEWLPAEKTPPREECDWSLWLGPAPWRPYNKAYVGGKWRGIYDFDSGARLLDWGAHTVDLCQWANDADATAPIEYEPTEKGIECRYANGVRLFLDFLADPFGNRGPNWNTKLGTCPVKFIGSEGWVETGDAGGTDLSNESLRASVPAAEKVAKGTDAALHARNFIDSVKSRRPAVCNADVMRKSHIACHAAANAWILGRKLSFDPAKEIFTTPSGPDTEANGLSSRPARNPWG